MLSLADLFADLLLYCCYFGLILQILLRLDEETFLDVFKDIVGEVNGRQEKQQRQSS